jgi:hypothetical protein
MMTVGGMFGTGSAASALGARQDIQLAGDRLGGRVPDGSGRPAHSCRPRSRSRGMACPGAGARDGASGPRDLECRAPADGRRPPVARSGRAALRPRRLPGSGLQWFFRPARHTLHWDPLGVVGVISPANSLQAERRRFAALRPLGQRPLPHWRPLHRYLRGASASGRAATLPESRLPLKGVVATGTLTTSAVARLPRYVEWVIWEET